MKLSDFYSCPCELEELVSTLQNQITVSLLILDGVSRIQHDEIKLIFLDGLGEDQAFSRMYRIGQTKSCTVVRYIMEDSIETELMLVLQQSKALECNRIIDGKAFEELSMDNLLKLFGTVKKYARGRPIIQHDDEESIEEFVVGSDRMVIDDSDDETLKPAPSRGRSISR